MHELLELANHYPSPHNGQPIRLRWINETELEFFFARERGLQATDVSYLFSFVSIGVFIRHFEYACQALGHRVTYELQLPTEADLHGTGTMKFATAHIDWNLAEPDSSVKDAILFRQTSRLKYTEAPSKVLTDKILTLVGNGMELKGLTKKQSQYAIWLNQRAVFDDMFDDAVRSELNHWLRYSKEEKEAKNDGLSYDCMQLSGRAMKFCVDHYKILRFPIVAPLLRQYYLRTMKDSSQVFYMTAPFKTPQDACEAGQVIMDIWKEVSKAREYLHPFGTIMSNADAHTDFASLAGIPQESRESNYLVFIFRLGKSMPPVRSARIPYKDHLIME